MRNPLILPGPRVRLVSKAALLSGATIALLGVTEPARADLTAEFQAVLTVDTDYATGVNNATDIAWAPDGRAVITRKSGQVAIRAADGMLTTVNNPFPGMIDTGSEKGLLGVAADPTTAGAFFFYVSNGSSNGDKHRVYRGQLTETNGIDIDDNPLVGAVSGAPGLEGPANHDGGGVLVYDGKLYVAVGDTGANMTPPTNKYASCLNKPNGKILRVNLDGSVPDDNPLVGVASVTTCDSTGGDWGTGAPDTRIWAWGFRNPFRFWIDAQTNLLWVGQVGETTRESVAVGPGNSHFGYPFWEGDRNWGSEGDVDGRSDCMDNEPARPCIEAVHSYPTLPFQSGGSAVTGGLIPEGCGWSTVFATPTYIFGDSSESWIRTLSVNAARDGLTTEAASDFGEYDNGRPVAFHMGPGDSLYVVLHGTGAVYRMTPTDQTGCDPGGTGGTGGMSGTGGTPTEGGTAGSGDGGTPASGGGGMPATNGGMPATGGAATTGGNGPSTGGAANTGGAGTTGGAASTGGNRTGGAPGTGGTSPGSGGTPTVAGTASGGALADSGDDGSCGCRVVGRPANGMGALAALGALGLLVGRRRRR